MTPPVPDIPGSELVFRRARSVRAPLLWSSVSLLILAGLAALAGLGGPGLGPAFYAIAGVLGLAAVGSAAAYLAEGSFRTTVRPSGITTRGFVRRTIPWSDVAGFQVRGPGAAQSVGSEQARPVGPREIVGSVGRSGFAPTGHADARTLPQAARARIVVLRTHGRPLRLPAPVVAGEKGDYRFADDVRQLEQWRVHYAGPSPSASVR